MKYVQRHDPESNNWFLLHVATGDVVAVREEEPFRNPDNSLIDEIEPVEINRPRARMSDPLQDYR